MPAQDRSTPSSSKAEERVRQAQAQRLADQAEASARHERFMLAVAKDRRSRAGRAAVLVGVAILAMMAGPARPRGAASLPRPPHRRRPRPGGFPLPQTVRPDRPNTLTGGAAAELTFDD